MAKADSTLIHWLLHNSGLSRYRISKELNIAESTLSRIARGDTPMDKIQFGSASKLTDYAERVKHKQEVMREGGKSHEQT